MGVNDALSLSEDGLTFLSRQEGYRPYAYNDSAGNPTIGYGHKLLPGEAYPRGLEQEAALVLLRQDTAHAAQTIRDVVNVALSQTQFDALVSLAYNIGLGAFARSHLLMLINEEDTGNIAAAWLAWDHVTNDGELCTNAGLLARREREVALYKEGVY